MARTVLRSEVVLLLDRCPEVVQFRFAAEDATPFATQRRKRGWPVSGLIKELRRRAQQSSAHSEVLPEGLSRCESLAASTGNRQ
jgi:hypothetical protein